MTEEIKSFIMNEIAPEMREWEKAGMIPRSTWEQIGKRNLIGISCQPEGNGLRCFADFCRLILDTRNLGLIASLAINEIAYKLFHTLDNGAHANQLEEVCEGKKILSMCITEPNAGSDVGALESRTHYEKGQYVLYGEKTLIANAPIADYYLVAARTEVNHTRPWNGISIFMIERGTDGLFVSENIEKAGAALLPLGNMQFKGCRIPEDNLLGKKGKGFFYLMNILHFERMVISTMIIYFCEVILNDTISHLKKRTIFGQPLSDYQHVRFCIADLFSQVQICKSFIERLVQDYDNDMASDSDIMISKLKSTELVKEIASKCQQLLGGHGYISKSWFSNLYDDVRWTSIAGGANELLLDLIGKRLLN